MFSLPSVQLYCYIYVKFSKMKPPFHMISGLDHYLKSDIAKIELGYGIPNTEFSVAIPIRRLYTQLMPQCVKYQTSD